MSIYCVYLTVYRGNKLPPFYIGSTNIDKINKGYRGSVRSKKYRSIWEHEAKRFPELFKTLIISKHNNRKDALKHELNIQKSLDVVKNPLYVNQSLASTNGFFGRDVSGMNNPNYGNKNHLSPEQRHKSSIRAKENHANGICKAPGSFPGKANGRYGDHRTTFKDKNGNTVCTSSNDPRVISGELVGIGTNPDKIIVTKLSPKFPNSGATTGAELYQHIYNTFLTSNLNRTAFCKKYNLTYTTFLKILNTIQE